MAPKPIQSPLGPKIMPLPDHEALPDAYTQVVAHNHAEAIKWLDANPHLEQWMVEALSDLEDNGVEMGSTVFDGLRLAIGRGQVKGVVGQSGEYALNNSISPWVMRVLQRRHPDLASTIVVRGLHGVHSTACTEEVPSSS